VNVNLPRPHIRSKTLSISREQMCISVTPPTPRHSHQRVTDIRQSPNQHHASPLSCLSVSPCLPYHLLRKQDKSVWKAPGDKLAPPSFYPHPAFSLPMLSTGSDFKTDPRKFGPLVLQLVMLLYFSEATPQRSFASAASIQPCPWRKGGVNKSIARLCF
jgi:hypothetical protein